MTEAYSYTRWSSAKQSFGDSKRRQTSEATEYAALNGLTLSEQTYEDAGVSAYRSKNAVVGQLAAFLEAVDSGVIKSGSILLVENFDRLSRAPVLTALRLFQDIVDRGITLVTLTDRQVYNTKSIDDNWTQLVSALAYMARAHEENKRKGGNVKKAWDAKRAAGGPITSVSPAWLTLVGNKWEVDKKRAHTVHRIFELSDKGLGSPTIARRLNEDKVPTFGRALAWSNGLVAHVLKNSAVIGTFTPKKAKAEPVESYYPAIIEKSLFYAVQAKFKDRTWSVGNTGTNITNLFSGIGYCGECGSKLRLVSSAKPHIYLRCIRAYSNAGCEAERIPYTPVEKEMLGFLLLDQDADLMSLVTKKVDASVGIKGDLATKKAQRERLLDAIMDGTITRETAGTRSAKLETDIKALEHALTTAVPTSAVSEAIQAAFGLYEAHEQATLSGEGLYDIRLKLQAAIRRVVKRIEFRNGCRMAVTIDGVEKPIVREYEKPLKGFQLGNRNGSRHPK